MGKRKKGAVTGAGVASLVEPSEGGFEVFHDIPKPLSQIDVRDMGDSYSITLTSKKDLVKGPTLRFGSVKFPTLRVGSLEIETYVSGGLYGGGGNIIKGTISGFTKTQVTPSGRTLTAQVPKAPALGFLSIPGKLVCPGLVVDIPRRLGRGYQIHVAVIDRLAAPDSRISVDRGALNVSGATLRLDADGASLHYSLLVDDPSAAKEFRVELERNKFSEVLASSKDKSYLNGSWSPAKPSSRRVIAGHKNPFGTGDFNEKMLREALGAKSLVVGDPAPNTKYSIKLVAKRGRFRRGRVDKASVTFL